MMRQLNLRLSFLRFGYPWMIVWAIGIHINTGLFILINKQVVTLLPFIGLKEFGQIGISINLIAVGLIVVGFLAMVGLLIEERISARATLLFLLPQYGLMIAAILSDTHLMISGVHTASGAPVAFSLIEPLTFLIMFAAILHTISIIERFVLEPRR